MVGREELVTSLAERLQDGALYHWEVLHGEPGVGKTVVSIAVAYELLDKRPWQEFMQGSSPAVLHADHDDGR